MEIYVIDVNCVTFALHLMHFYGIILIGYFKFIFISSDLYGRWGANAEKSEIMVNRG
jgi:hypothetical protein